MVFPLAATITGVSSLLGGLFSKPDKPQYVVPDYAGIRRAAEAAGFNPLTALTQGMQGSVVSGGGGYMGQAIADAGLALADGLTQSKRAGLLSRVQSENAQLREKVQAMTLRPKVGGVYAQRQATPTVPQAMGVSNAASVQLGASDVGGVGSVVSGAGADASGLRPLPETLSADPRRAVDNKPQQTTSGFMVVDNPHLGFPWYVPSMDGDEAMTIGEAPIAIPSLIGSYMYDHWQKTARFRETGSLAPVGWPARGPLKPSKTARVIGSHIGRKPKWSDYNVPLPLLKYPHVPFGLSGSGYAWGRL